MTGLTACLLVLFLALGRWQWDRAEYKQAQLQKFAACVVRAEYLGVRSTRDVDRYARITLSGRWDLSRQFLLDNRTREGRAGFEVLTPFQLDDGRWVLVNRGWILFEGFRDQLPDLVSTVPAADRDQTLLIEGRVDELPRAGLASGRSAPRETGDWPKVTSFPETAELARAMGLPQEGVLEPRQILLDAQSGSGYRRDWSAFAVGKGPEQNWSYAIQWWSFAVVLLILYVSLNLRRQPTAPETDRE
jgi:surfeit locus 1 family protein